MIYKINMIIRLPDTLAKKIDIIDSSVCEVTIEY